MLHNCLAQYVVGVYAVSGGSRPRSFLGVKEATSAPLAELYELSYRKSPIVQAQLELHVLYNLDG